MLLRYIGRDVENIGRNHGGVLARRRELPSFTVDQLRDFRPIFRFLNEKDRDILYLIFVARKKQKDVQRVLKRSQPSLCYDIKRIRRRLKFISYLNSVFDVFMDFLQNRREELPEENRSEILDILALMFFTSCLSQTAKILGIPQVRVRYLFDKAIATMEQCEMWDVYEIFMAIRRNLNIVRRVYRPYGEGRSKLDDVFLPA